MKRFTGPLRRREISLGAKELEAVGQPVHFVWGEHDPFGPSSVGQRAAAIIPVEHHPPHALAAPTHVHQHEDEFNFVLAGRMGAHIGSDEIQASPGQLVVKPRGWGWCRCCSSPRASQTAKPPTRSAAGSTGEYALGLELADTWAETHRRAQPFPS